MKTFLVQDGAYFMDRDPDKFKIILNYLREKKLPELNKSELKNLSVEALYFQLNELEAEINGRLDDLEVYKFKNESTQYLAVKKSLFGDIPHYAIVNLFEKGKKKVKKIFRKRDFVTSDDNEIITVKHFYCSKLDDDIERGAQRLKAYAKIMRTQQITFDLHGHFYSLSLEAACKDPESLFSEDWYDHQPCGFIYFTDNHNFGVSRDFKHTVKVFCLKLDEETLEEMADIDRPTCNDSFCYDYDILHTTEERVNNTLSKFEAAEILNEFLYISNEHEREILYKMCLLSDKFSEFEN